MADVCVPRCQRAPECGDGYACDGDGYCRRATGQLGDGCTSEVECATGLSCQIDGDTVNERDRLLASCTASNTGRPAGAACVTDSDCRNGTCGLGHCLDLCANNRDCAAGQACMAIPRVEAAGALFGGCLLAQGNVVWSIPVLAPNAEILLPVPERASYASLVFSVDDAAQKVGAVSVRSPTGTALYRVPCDPSVATCSLDESNQQYYANLVRHRPEPGQSVLAMPSNPQVALETGAYRVLASSFRPNGTAGSAIPNVTAVIRLDSAVILDLHLYFLDLDDHPCAPAFDAGLDAATASTESFFQSDFLGQIRGIFSRGGIALGGVTYHDVPNHPELDGLDIVDAGALLALGAHAKGINVFFVRTLSPVGLQAFGPGPGPAGLAGTRKSGIVIGIDTLCYRSWRQLARLTAHEIGRYMGLYHNVELDPRWTDPIADTDDIESKNNLMFFSELGGEELSPGQRNILTRSPVLR
ncbi:MAG: hypothetical protein H0T89_23225 [Deltaproteobacteria bacterium]|nr:hypothetical protein [Deltaproteobacteria bacterium]MDQ3296618.1 hypothetical protein [Myxococcota bacterium]